MTSAGIPTPAADADDALARGIHSITDPIGPLLGVKGDGSDETLLINAHTAAAALGRLGVFWPLPPVAYVASSLVLSTGYVWFGLPGRGGRPRLKMADGAAGGGVAHGFIDTPLLDADGVLPHDFSLTYLEVNGNRAANNHSTEFIFGVAIDDCHDFEITHCLLTNWRGDGIRIGRTATAAHHFAIYRNDFLDCGIKEAGDAQNTRMGIAVIAGAEFDVTDNYFDACGAVCIDLEANGAGDLFTNVLIKGNRFGLNAAPTFFINVSPTVAANATGIEILGNNGRGAPAKGIFCRATGYTIAGNIGLAVLDVGIQVEGTNGSVSGSNVFFPQRNTAGTRAPVILNNCTHTVVSGNALLGTNGTGGVVETGTSDFNSLGPNLIDHGTPYVVLGANTATEHVRRVNLGINPASGGARVDLTGTSGTIRSLAGILTLEAAAANAQIFFQQPSIEYARFNTSGELAVQQPIKWAAAGIAQTTVGAAGGGSAPPATPVKYLKVKDSGGTTLVIPAYNP